MKNIFCAIVLFAYMGDMRAEESEPEKIHIVGLPADETVLCWTKESNKDGMKGDITVEMIPIPPSKRKTKKSIGLGVLPQPDYDLCFLSSLR